MSSVPLPATKVAEVEAPNKLLGDMSSNLMANTFSTFSLCFFIPAEHLHGESLNYTKSL